MNDLLKETGVLTDHGKEIVKDFKNSLKALLEIEEVNMLNAAEVRTLGAVLASMIGNEISNQILEVSKLSTLTKETIPDYFVAKYGFNWGFSKLTKEEYAFWFKLNPSNNLIETYPLDTMTEEEFNAHIHSKYGLNWLFSDGGLTQKELKVWLKWHHLRLGGTQLI